MTLDSGYAKAPFDHKAADVILRSSNDVDFRVFKLFLSLASPFFEALFTIPQPPVNRDQEFKDGLAVVLVTEHSETLDIVLRFCYPCTLAEDPVINVLENGLDVLGAVRKYSFDVVEKKVRQAFANPGIFKAEPLRCFAIAHHGRLREETLLAARYTLTQPLASPWFKEIELVTATDLLSVLTYRRRCSDAVNSLAEDLSWITLHKWSSEWVPFHDYFNCQCRRADSSKYAILGLPTYWWENFMTGTFENLRDKPCRETVLGCAEKTITSQISCPSCSTKITKGMDEFVDLFLCKIDEKIGEVELELNF